MVYQEQIMQVSMVMSGFSAGKADKLRKAMGKKKLDVMHEAERRLDAMALSKTAIRSRSPTKFGHDAEKFAKYAFNKSHSAAYAILGYAHGVFEVALPERVSWPQCLSSYMGNADKLIKYIAELQPHSGIPVFAARRQLFEPGIHAA